MPEFMTEEGDRFIAVLNDPDKLRPPVAVMLDGTDCIAIAGPDFRIGMYSPAELIAALTDAHKFQQELEEAWRVAGKPLARSAAMDQLDAEIRDLDARIRRALAAEGDAA